jgi:hypothetical protein
MADLVAEDALSAVDQLRNFVGRANGTTVILTALGLGLRSRISGENASPVVAQAVNDVLQQAGLAGAVDQAPRAELGPILALIRAELLFGGYVLKDGMDARGWQDRDADVLQSFGEVSLGFWRVLQRFAAGSAPGLLDRLGPVSYTHLRAHETM